MSVLFIAYIIFLKYFQGKIPSDFSINGTDFLFNLFCFALEVAILFNWKGFEPIDMSSVFSKDVFDKYKEKIRKIRFSLFALLLVLSPFLINFVERSTMIWCYGLFLVTIDEEIALILATPEERKTYFQRNEGQRYKGISIFIIIALISIGIYACLFR
ncbi:MAG: hypothetical protein IJ730_01840 [Alphaproteobacteria bacterium]|nr:hypothetical protein [Alphaproteobacteria bacterium]